MQTYGEWIRAERLRRGMKNRDVASQAGISMTHLWRIETSKQRPGSGVALRMAEMFGDESLDVLRRWLMEKEKRGFRTTKLEPAQETQNSKA